MTADANPVVKVGNYIATPSLPKIERYQFTRIDFENEIMQLYGDKTASTIEPDAPRSHYFWSIKQVFDEESLDQPVFITDDSWQILQQAPSGFLTSVASVMPKLFIPSKLLVDNGIANIPGKKATNPDGTECFNWSITGGSLTKEEIDVTGNYGSRLVTIKQKNDEGVTSNTIELSDSEKSPTGNWNPKSPLVVTGAFVVVLNVVPVIQGKGLSTDAENKWNVKFTFGEVEMRLDDTGTLSVNIGENISRAQLSDSQAKEKPPQVSQLISNPYTLVVYPVWNGVIVSSGIQDVRNVVKVSSQFCVKKNGASINDVNYQQRGKGGETGGFEALNPDDIYIKVTDDVKVDFGEKLTINAENCRYELAYLPLFFSPSLMLDSFFISDKDQEGPPEILYEYDVYPVWTDNDAPYSMDESLHTQNEIDQYSEWRYANFNFSASKPNRRAGELFAYIIRTKEDREVTTETSNGMFNLVATGGTPAGPSDSWTSYIKSISTTVGLDGSSGQIVVDKYGFSGQTSVAVQDIGALTLTVSSAPLGSYKGLIFSGLGMGISDSMSSDGGDFTVNLNGLEKKFEDIVLINVPFFDGERLIDVLQFLCRYAGIVPDVSHADSSCILPSSEDIQSPLIDFKTGTTVGDAINQLMELSAHNYVIHKNGICRFYKLRQNGLPYYIGTDYSSYHPNTRKIAVDNTPDFEDLRNEIIAVGLRKVETSSRDSTDVIMPDFPLIVSDYNYTKPYIPWSKGMLYGVPGFVTEERLGEIVDNLKSLTSQYELAGRVTVPGDSRLEPYQMWGEYIIISVTQNLDLQNKSWTTDIELGSANWS